MRRFLPFLVGLLALALFIRVDFFFTIAYLFFLIYLLTRLWTQRLAGRVRVRRLFSDRAFFGDRLVVTLLLNNTTSLPVPWLQLHESLPVELRAPPFYQEVLSLAPREKRQLTYTLYCQKRGCYAIGPSRAQTGDLLGLLAPGEVTWAADRLTVYPQVVPLHRLGLPTRSPLAVLPARSPLFEDPARLCGVRDYRSGDSLRRIHWTATAAGGRLLVKQYQPAISRETLICLNLNAGDYAELHRRYDAPELAIVVAASLANHMIVNERLPAGLAAEAFDQQTGAPARFFLPPRSERAHLINLLEVLARVQTAPGAPFMDLLRHSCSRLTWGATLAVITGRESVELFETLAYLRHAGFAVAVILIQPARPASEAQRQAELLRLPIYRVWRDKDMEHFG